MEETYQYFETKERLSQKRMDVVYKELWPNFTADRTNACYDFDFEMKDLNGCIKLIEEKFRYEDYNDFLMEIIQDIKTADTKGLGWFYKTKADYIFYVVKDEKLYTINWRLFKTWFLNNISTLNYDIKVSDKGWGCTVNFCLRWFYIPEEYYKIYILML